MAAIGLSSLIIHGLKKSQAVALRKKAQGLGLTTEDYVRELIATDLAVDQEASSKSFDELALPFEKALKGLSDEELDKVARPNRRRAKQ